MFMYYLGIFLLVWLAVGFMMGLKGIYFDKIYEGHIQRYLKQLELEGKYEDYFSLLKNKYNFLIICTLSGFLVLFADFIGTFKSIDRN